jgi:hypothetical protein
MPLSSQLASNLHHPGRHRRLLFSAAARIRRARNHCKSEVVTKVLSTPVPVPVRTDSRRSSGASGQNGLGHGEEYFGSVRTAETDIGCAVRMRH